MLRPFAAVTLLFALASPAAAVVGVPRASEPAWISRHDKTVAAASKNAADIVLLGDSITQGWQFHAAAWTTHFSAEKTLNAGIASDRVEQVLWRVEHGLFAVARPKAVVLMAGINNLAVSSPAQIADGLAAIIAAVHARSPETKILLIGLLPSGKEATHKRRPKIRAVNALAAKLADDDRVFYVDVGARFLDADGTLPKATAFDALHLTRKGYGIWAEALDKPLNGLLTSTK